MIGECLNARIVMMLCSASTLTGMNSALSASPRAEGAEGDPARGVFLSPTGASSLACSALLVLSAWAMPRARMRPAALALR